MKAGAAILHLQRAVRGVFAKSKVQQVEKIVRIIREMGNQPATPADARALPGHKGGDRVEYRR